VPRFRASLVGVLALLASVLGPTAAASAAEPPPRAGGPFDPRLGFACFTLERAILPLPDGSGVVDRLARVRLVLDGGVRVALQSLPKTGSGGQTLQLAAMRRWRNSLSGVLSAVSGGADPQTTLDAVQPGIDALIATLAPIVPSAAGVPCQLTADAGSVVSKPAAAAVAFEAVLAAVADRSTADRLRAEAPEAQARLASFRAQLQAMKAAFPLTAAQGRALLPSLRRIVDAAGRGDGGGVATRVARLSGPSPFLLRTLANQTPLSATPPQTEPAPGTPTVAIPPTTGMTPEAALRALCTAGLETTARSEVIGEASRGRERARARALAAARTPAAKAAVRRRFAEVQVLGTLPAAGSAVAAGDTVTLRLGVLAGSAIAIRTTC
jgi:hypothetical protein